MSARDLAVQPAIVSRKTDISHVEAGVASYVSLNNLRLEYIGYLVISHPTSSSIIAQRQVPHRSVAARELPVSRTSQDPTSAVPHLPPPSPSAGQP